MRTIRLGLLTLGLLGPLGAAVASAADWTPTLWIDESTLELRMTEPDGEPHWFPVWPAVVDDQLYVRLGTRATGRAERNTTAPYVGVRIAGETFERVRAEPAPDMADPVAGELAQKYWSDLLIRFFPHPLTLRLVPEPE
jgi:hypothetical protein